MSFADDVAVVPTNEITLAASQNIHHPNLFTDWYTTWRTKVKQKKVCPHNIHHETRNVPTSKNEQRANTYSPERKYLGLHLD
jgi:hypothetical protein